MDADERGSSDLLTGRVLGAVFEVSNTLGAGFLEKVYERALLRELALRNIRARLGRAGPGSAAGLGRHRPHSGQRPASESAFISVNRRLRRTERYCFRTPLSYWPQMNADERGCSDLLTERVLGAVFGVSNTLGAGFLEKVYERALLRELALRGIRATAQASFSVTYKGHCVGEYFADIVVEEVLVIELKCVECLSNEHIAQCLNYLRASGRSLCLLVNFQKPRVEWKRIVHGL